MAGKAGMKATQKLPATYTAYDRFNPSRWRKTHYINWVFGLVLALLSYSALRFTALTLRPDFQPAALGFKLTTLERLVSFSGILLPVAVVLAVHELIHFILLWFFTGNRPTMIVGVGGVAVQLPSWYIPRDQFLIANFAPFCFISLAGLLSLPVVPQEYLSSLIFLTAINMAGSAADITSSAYILLHPSSICLETDGTIFFDSSVGPDAVPAWKLRARSSIEAAIARLDP